MKPKIALVVSTPATFKSFYRNHIDFLKREYDVTLISNYDGNDRYDVEGVKQVSIAIARKPHPTSDLVNLFKLILLFRKEKFTVVHSTTPKAGLLSQMAAKLSGVKVRLHTFTGQVWANKQGLKRDLLKGIDKVIALSASNLLADSGSQKDFLEKEKVVAKNKVKVLGQGSIAGVSLTKFHPMDSSKLKTDVGIVGSGLVFLFIGRLNRDKGILDLLKAFETVNKTHPDSNLVIVGRDEENLLPLIEGHELFGKSLFFEGFTPTPEKYMSMADALCLPSYREGFGSVIIEASACGTPSIGSNIYGVSDAIEDGKSGLLFEVGNVNDLSDKMIGLIESPDQLKQLSDYGLDRVKQHFEEKQSSTLLLSYYKEIIEANNNVKTFA